MEQIRRLASESYAERVDATRQLWAEGASAKADLLKAARSRDPEVAMRARDLIRKINLGIEPDTDPKIIELTDNYRTASATEKNTIYHELRSLRAWRQILRLYAIETDMTLKTNLARMIDSIALVAARERIAKGDNDGALEYLEMARDTENGLIAIAAFHRASGTLEGEIEALGEPTDANAWLWQAAMHRAAGDADAAATAARKAGNERVAATMDMLMGNPLPWLKHAGSEQQGQDAMVARYAQAAAARWRGEPWSAELNQIRRQLRSTEDATRMAAISHLFLLGDVEPAWKHFADEYPEEAFASFDSLERLDEALAVVGVDGEPSEIKKSLLDLLSKVCVPPGKALDDEEIRENVLTQCVGICGFLERRGMASLLDEVVLPKALKFAEIHQSRFIDLISGFFGVSGSRSAAPELALRIASAWAGDDPERWNEMRIAAFGDEHEYMLWWELLQEVDDKAPPALRMQAMLAIFGYTRDREELYQSWIDAIWAHAADADRAATVLPLFGFLSATVTDIDLFQRIRSVRAVDNPVEDDAESSQVNLLVDAALGHWDDVAELFLQQIAVLAQRGDARAELHAYASVSLRNAGRVEDANAHESWVESLALGDARTNLAVAQAFAFGRDYDRAFHWYRRAVMESAPGDNRFRQALDGYLVELLERRDYALVASCSEVLAQWESKEPNFGFAPAMLVRIRQQSDFGRAMAMLTDRRSEAISLLRSAHGIAPTDGALADHFFPSLLESPLQELRKELFEISWRKITANLTRFPDADNTMNTAVWFASRAGLRLEEAKVMQQRALKLWPRSAAYLDTLAEVYFALGNRREAVRLGRLALRYIPHDPMIIRQHERFLNGELPSR